MYVQQRTCIIHSQVLYCLSLGPSLNLLHTSSCSCSSSKGTVLVFINSKYCIMLPLLVVSMQYLQWQHDTIFMNTSTRPVPSLNLLHQSQTCKHDCLQQIYQPFLTDMHNYSTVVHMTYATDSSTVFNGHAQTTHVVNNRCVHVLVHYLNFF